MYKLPGGSDNDDGQAAARSDSGSDWRDGSAFKMIGRSFEDLPFPLRPNSESLAPIGRDWLSIDLTPSGQNF